MKIEERLISSILPYARNPRRNDQAINKVASSIKEFGFRQPIVVDKDGTVVAGHTRLEAAYKLGLKSVPVHVAEDLTEIQAKAYRIADNRVAQESEWDIDLLRLEMEELKDEIDLDLTGFDESELDKILVEAIEGLTDPDEVPEVEDDPVTDPGDLIELGRHRLICGDSTDPDHVSKVMGEIKPLLMVTDPPYGVNYDPAWRQQRGVNKAGPGAATGVVLNDHNADWRETWSLFTGSVAYIWHAGLNSHLVAESLIATDFVIRTQIIWNKSSLLLGRGDYHWKHEPCWYAVKKGQTGQYVGHRKQSTVWDIDKPRTNETGHTTQKPVECMKRPIENNSSPGQAVYDPFLGSGTTLIAAEMTGRQCIGIELNPQYCDVIITRWSNFTGKDEVTINGKPVSWKKHQLEKAA